MLPLAIVAVVVGVALLVGIVFLLCYCCCCRRRGKSENGVNGKADETSTTAKPKQSPLHSESAIEVDPVSVDEESIDANTIELTRRPNALLTRAASLLSRASSMLSRDTPSDSPKQSICCCYRRRGKTGSSDNHPDSSDTVASERVNGDAPSEPVSESSQLVDVAAVQRVEAPTRVETVQRIEVLQRVEAKVERKSAKRAVFFRNDFYEAARTPGQVSTKPSFEPLSDIAESLTSLELCARLGDDRRQPPDHRSFSDDFLTSRSDFSSSAALTASYYTAVSSRQRPQSEIEARKASAAPSIHIKSHSFEEPIYLDYAPPFVGCQHFHIGLPDSIPPLYTAPLPKQIHVTEGDNIEMRVAPILTKLV